MIFGHFLRQETPLATILCRPSINFVVLNILFRRLGEAALTRDVTDAVQEILEEEDRDKFQALVDITSNDVFVAAHDLNLVAKKRLLSLLLREE